MKTFRYLIMVASCGAAFVSFAQQPAAYPSKGQSSTTQANDESSCRNWAQSQTGISPNAAAQPAPQQTGPAVGGGQRVGGALRGAAAGAVVGGVANNNAGHGAAVGAAAGVVAGGVRARQDRRAQNQAAANQQTNTQATFNQAYGSCMKGRGYTIN